MGCEIIRSVHWTFAATVAVTTVGDTVATGAAGAAATGDAIILLGGLFVVHM